MKQAEFFYNNPNAPKPNKPNLVGTTILIEYQDMLLLEHRMDSERWAIIGGSLKNDESFVECAIRETKEETSIDLDESMIGQGKLYDAPSIIISYPDGNIFRSITIAYRVKLTEEPKLVCSEESKELKFFTKEELKSVKIVETHIPILQDYLHK
ncbi:MAG: NUDIX domain-containing protein [Lachnospiraceae bacterium]|nr:NUDIX domain-containing protein [Lachnospiraceae bacterium]MBQ7781558.1 NUDIX domain-containing protein [Lachnospiraceae bacterium]